MEQPTSASESTTAPLSVWLNAYGDLQTTEPSEFGTSPSAFSAQLDALLARPDAQRGVWVRLPWARAELLPALALRGFAPHHWAHGDAHLVLHAWRRGGPNPTPTFAHVDVGCGALVVNAEGHLLGICEKFDVSGRWNPPGGHLDEGEDLLACAVREAREETGVDAVALGVSALHEQQMPWARPDGAPPPDAATRGAQEHASRWGSTHHGFYVLCAARSDALAPDASEVSRAEWLPPARWASSFTAHVMVVVAAAQASGQIAAAVAAAHALRLEAAGGPAAPAAFGAPALLGAAALALPSKYGAPHAHVFYHAQPATLFAAAAGGVAAARGAPGVRAVGRGDVPVAAARATAAGAPQLLVAATLLVGVGAALGFAATKWRR